MKSGLAPVLLNNENHGCGLEGLVICSSGSYFVSALCAINGARNWLKALSLCAPQLTCATCNIMFANKKCVSLEFHDVVAT